MEPVDFPGISSLRFYGRRSYCHLNPALEDISSSDNQNEIDIVIIPPNVDEQTDEEEFDDNNIQEFSMPNDVAGEIELQHMDSDIETSDEESNLPLSILRQNITSEKSLATKTKRRNLLEPKWTKDVVDTSMPSTCGFEDRVEVVKHDLEHLSPIEVFEKLFDQEVLDHIVQQTNLYSSQKNKHDFFVSKADIQIFISILLLTGYHKLPSERNYWSLDEDLRVPFVSNSMSRNRFLEIKKYIHLANNSCINRQDKMSKIRPLMSLLNQKFQQWGVFHQNLSIDEAMVKFFGRHSSKQYIKGKPVRFGYKNWALCSCTGYCYSFDTYCGAKNSRNQNSDLPLGSKVVLDLLTTVAVPSDHVVFFDNYFSSHALLRTLKD
ncbi:hypothetical protein PPYR_00046 [Photinus pyralis]|uniref:PiggyBac transposable element-derived protein domain-containing protein n=1 Tax=Photinus pyralis TaxID=7054 RepID=A0A5N4B0I2_PHOPY|nr:hypothetical protein PPYR_00046 [Photinus pyralis]